MPSLLTSRELPRAARRAGFACALVLACGSFARAEDDYRRLVERYGDGDRYRTVRELGRRDLGPLGDSVEALLAELRAPVQPSREARERRLETAALLHTDRAWLELGEGRDTPADKHVRWAWSYVLVADDLADPSPDLLSFARRWYLLQGLRGHGRLDAAHALHFLGEGLRRFHDDPALLLAVGSLDETLARDDAMRANVEDPAGPHLRSFRGPQRTLVERRALLERALGSYRAALRGDPGLEEARLRLGRVLQLLDRRDEAEVELRSVAGEEDEPGVRYLAHLFLGRLREDQRRLEEAAAEYRAAASLVPRSQTAHLALAQALDRLGERAGALEALQIALRTGNDEPAPFDAWWAYLFGQSGRAEALVEELRLAAAP
jgi:tetratricopeptide (TPR) repeat protein